MSQSLDSMLPVSPLSERHMRMLCRTMFEALVLVDDARRCLRINDAAAELLGAPRDLVRGGRIDHSTPAAKRPLLAELWVQLARDGILEVPFEVQRADGSHTMIDCRAVWALAPGQHLIAGRERSKRVDAGAPALTKREREVLQHAANGASSREIAETLVVSVGTVKTHFHHIYRKLDVDNRTSAAAEGMRRGLIR
jgi:DNA-binding CsgD family transcriptional regulator